jgi:predicted amidohydrolase
MLISVIQSDLAWEDKLLNFSKLGRLIEPLNQKTDIVILPEMFNTGFSMNPDHLGESPEDETFNWMKNIALNGNFGVCGSYIIKEGNHFYNRWLFVSPENEIWYYNKRHLFSMGGEDKVFTPGNKRLVFTFRGVRISPFICYDLRFPVFSRNRNDTDLLIYAANWPESRSEVWKTLLRARAIENQCYTAGVNRTGTDGEGIKYCGDSMIINPLGVVIKSCNQNTECSITTEISLTALSEERAKFPVLGQSDDFMIKL